MRVQMMFALIPDILLQISPEAIYQPFGVCRFCAISGLVTVIIDLCIRSERELLMKASFQQKVMALSLGLVLLTALWLPSSAKAEGIIYGNNINEGQVVDQNAILYGNDIVIDGTINGDVLAVGRTVQVNGQVNGSLLAIGETITINGEVTNSVMAGAVMMELSSEGQIGRELYFAGGRLSLLEGSTVQRDLYTLSMEAQLSGKIGRNIQAVIGPIRIVELILDLLNIKVPAITGSALPESVHGLAAQASGPMLTGLGAGALTPTSYWLIGKPQHPQQAAQIDSESLRKWAVPFLRNLVILLLIGLLIVWLIPSPFNWAGEKIKDAPWRALFSGLMFFLGGWFIAILAFSLILMLSIFFFYISLPNLGLLFGTLGLMGLGLAVSLFWLSIAYLSKIIVAILIGRLLLQRLIPRFAQSNFWPMLLGVILYALIASIPYLGWVIAAIVTFFGLGALGEVSFPSLTRRKVVESAPAVTQLDQ